MTEKEERRLVEQVRKIARDTMTMYRHEYNDFANDILSRAIAYFRDTVCGEIDNLRAMSQFEENHEELAKHTIGYLKGRYPLPEKKEEKDPWLITW